MSQAVNEAPREDLLRVLHLALVYLRTAARGRDCEKAEAIAEAIHNIPAMLEVSDRYSYSVKELSEYFIEPLIAQYPDLSDLRPRYQ